jgi:hypothetical protein
MKVLLNIGEMILGAGGLIVWVTVLALSFSLITPKKLRKKNVELTDCIAMGGIGLFCTILTLFFFFLAPKIGMARIDLSSVFGSIFSGGETQSLHRWLGRGIYVGLGVVSSFVYATTLFRRKNLKPFWGGLTLSLIIFLVGAIILFPVITMVPGIQVMDYELPTFFGSLGGNISAILTFFAATIIFGAVLSHIYNGWEEA